MNLYLIKESSMLSLEFTPRGFLLIPESSDVEGWLVDNEPAFKIWGWELVATGVTDFKVDSLKSFHPLKLDFWKDV